MRRLVLLLTMLLTVSAGPAVAGDGSWAWPVDGVRITTEFDPPDTPYGPGHRGVDLPTLVGARVHAVASGVVTYAGTVAGVGVISIDHGSERSTYQPVTAAVSVGDPVQTGDVIGQVALGAFHCASPCLHLGRVRQGDGSYLDPLDRLAGRAPIRLVDPTGPPPVPPVGASGSGLLQRPVPGPVTSGFGARTHPTTGEPSLHQGTDFGAPCGAPVRAAGVGTVVSVERSAAYGLQVVVRHPHGIESSYSHLSGATVAVGDDVTSDAVVGRVGSSGVSTGCHLHFGTRREGETVDPLTLL